MEARVWIGPPGYNRSSIEGGLLFGPRATRPSKRRLRTRAGLRKTEVQNLAGQSRIG